MTHSDLIKHGWHLTFARSRDKNPGSLMGNDWQSKLATTEQDVQSWLAKDANANVGVLLGPKSGIIDVEFDTDEGEQLLNEVLANDDPATPTYRSGKSIHRLYKWQTSLPNVTVPKIRGIEFRINSNNLALQSILPPSLHPSGRRYEWLDGLSPSEVDPVAMPFALWDLCHQATERKHEDQTDLDEQGDLYVAQGHRHDWLRDRIHHMAHWGLSERQLTSMAHLLDAEVAHFEEHDRDKKIQDFVRGSLKKRTVTEDELSVGEPVYKTEAITADQLLRKKIVREFAVNDLMVMGEPMVIGGASKSLKTSLMLDLAVAIVSGKPFLDHFEVPEPQPVMVISGESGELTIQEFLRSSITAKDLAPDDLKRLHLSYKLPKLDNVLHVDNLIQELKSKGIRIVFIDPLYRSFRAGEAASNIYQMGEKLELIAELLLKAGITVVLIHHFKKQGKSYDESPTIEDLSQSGIGEFARQFLFVKRRKEFTFDGNHTVWFQWGGSAGHQGLRILEAYTGTQKNGLAWETTLSSVNDWDQRQKDAKTEKQADQLRDRVLKVVRDQPGLGVNEIAEIVPNSGPALKKLVEEGLIHKVVGNNRKHMHYLNTEES